MSRHYRLRVDWAACDGHGLCSRWAPEVIELDEWGYPIVSAAPLASAVLPHAKAAVEACPVLALRLVRVRD